MAIKKLFKIICIFMIIFSIFCLIQNNISYASMVSIDIDGFEGNDSTGTEKVSSTLGQVLYVVQVIGAGMAVIMLICLAIKFVVSAPSERAELKKHMIIYVLGAVLMFGASAISAMVRNFVQQ